MGKKRHTRTYVSLAIGIALLAGLVLLLPDSDSLLESLKELGNAQPGLIAVAVLLMYATYPAAAYTVRSLGLRRVGFVRTLLVQIASGFASKLAPAGVGGFALNTRYLTKQKHTVVEASAVMAINNALGFVGHMLIVAAALLFSVDEITDSLSLSMSPKTWLVVVVVVTMLLAVVLTIPPVRRFAGALLEDIKKVRKYYALRPAKVLKGFLGASAVTLLFASALYVCVHALGFSLSPLQVLLVFTAGALGIALTPTPGGIGGAEAALTAGLIAVGVASTDALAIALLYRLVSYWLPVLSGFIAFQYCLRRRYI